MGKYTGKFTQCDKDCQIAGLNFLNGEWFEILDNDDDIPTTWVDVWHSGTVVRIAQVMLIHFLGAEDNPSAVAKKVHYNRPKKPSAVQTGRISAAASQSPQCTYCVDDWVSLQPGSVAYNLSPSKHYRVLDTDDTTNSIMLNNDDGSHAWYNSVDFCLQQSSTTPVTAMVNTPEPKFGMGDMAQQDPIYKTSLTISRHDKFEVIGVDCANEEIQIVVQGFPYWVSWLEFMNIGHRSNYRCKNHLPDQNEPEALSIVGMFILCTSRAACYLTFGSYYEIEQTFPSTAKIKVKNDKGFVAEYPEMNFSMESVTARVPTDDCVDENWED